MSDKELKELQKIKINEEYEYRIPDSFYKKYQKKQK